MPRMIAALPLPRKTFSRSLHDHNAERFLVGLLRMRLQRASMTDLVVELSKQPPPSRLRAALSAVLEDEHEPLAALIYDESLQYLLDWSSRVYTTDWV